MLEPLPARPVARFMLPLADVMTVLFSLFLLLPHLEQRGTAKSGPGAQAGGIWTAEEQLQAREELARFRRVTQTPTSQRLMVVVLAIDGQTGHLVLHEGPRQTKLTSEAEAGALIQRHLETARTGSKELFYVLQAPERGRRSTEKDDRNYRLWFGQHKVQYQLTGLQRAGTE